MEKSSARDREVEGGRKGRIEGEGGVAGREKRRRRELGGEGGIQPRRSVF